MASPTHESPILLGRLNVRHFRCFTQFATEFGPGMNFIIGPNASGKTSLLEAACLLLRLQSPRAASLSRVVQQERRGLVLDGYYGSRHLQFYYSPQRKKLALDGVEQTKSQAWLELARVVWFGNEDIALVRGNAERRRRFLDFIAAQRHPSYRAAHRAFDRALRSRNHLLKQPSPSWREIAAFDVPLAAHGTVVMNTRRHLVEELQPGAEAAQSLVSGHRERLRLEYLPGTPGDLSSALAAAQADDRRFRQTTVGPQRDDLRLTLDDRGADEASEGQQRTLVFALMLGAAQLLEQAFGQPPLLLLDDIFGELDPERRNALLDALPASAQKILTTTHLDWLHAGSGQQILRLEK